MPGNILEKIIALMPDELRMGCIQTTRGYLMCENDDLLKGPKYLIQLSSPLAADEFDWDQITPFFNSGNENACRRFFSECNGFSIGNQFVAPGIHEEIVYEWSAPDSFLRPFDFRNLAYGSYPEFAPATGYFVASLLRDQEEIEICDIVTPEGNIVSGRFRENSEVTEHFDNFESWIRTRVPQALESMDEMDILTW